jgi:hypothetical protein
MLLACFVSISRVVPVGATPLGADLPMHNLTNLNVPGGHPGCRELCGTDIRPSALFSQLGVHAAGLRWTTSLFPQPEVLKTFPDLGFRKLPGFHRPLFATADQTDRQFRSTPAGRVGVELDQYRQARQAYTSLLEDLKSGMPTAVEFAILYELRQHVDPGSKAFLNMTHERCILTEYRVCSAM